jgi:hypothetical protein
MGKDNKPIRGYLLTYICELLTILYIDPISDPPSSDWSEAQDSFT